MLGHANPAITARYAHAAPEHFAEMARHADRAISGGANVVPLAKEPR